MDTNTVITAKDPLRQTHTSWPRNVLLPHQAHPITPPPPRHDTTSVRVGPPGIIITATTVTMDTARVPPLRITQATRRRRRPMEAAVSRDAMAPAMDTTSNHNHKNCPPHPQWEGVPVPLLLKYGLRILPWDCPPEDTPAPAPPHPVAMTVVVVQLHGPLLPCP